MIDQGEGMVPYQGFTPIAGSSLSDCAETYFAQSEQLPTRFAVSFGQSAEPGRAAHWRAGGVMLQHMPRPGMAVAAEGGSGEAGLLGRMDILDGDEGENWIRANTLLDTVEEMELIGPNVSPTELLVRLFHEEIPRAFDAQPVRFGCSCGPEKVRQTMSIYSPARHRQDDDAGRRGHRRLPVLRRALRVRPDDAGLRGSRIHRRDCRRIQWRVGGR